MEINDLLNGTPSPATADRQDTSKTGLAWLKTWVGDVRSSQAWVHYQYVDVTFNGTANADTDIRHDLLPNTPELIDYEIVALRLPSAPATAPVIYTDSGPNRRKWGAGYIVLRANVASLSATLRLTLRSPS